MASTPPCLSCGKPFKPNGGLASIPEAQRIAFDPDNGRVWRICDSCHEWNLLGTEAAADAMPELRARFAVGVQGSALEGIDAAEASERLILLRVGAASQEPVQQLFVKRRARELFRHHCKMLVLTLVGGSWLLYEAVTRTWSAWMLPAGLLYVGALELIQITTDRRAGAVSHWRGAWPYAVLATLGVSGVIITAPTWWPVIPLLAIGGWLASRRLTPRYAVHLTLDGAPWVKLSEEQVAAIRVGWDLDTYELSLTGLPDGSAWRGPNAEILLQTLLGRDNAARPRKVIEAGHRLAEQVGQAKGVLRMLEGVRREQDNQIDVATLPPVYQVALDMLLAPDLTFLGEADRLHERKDEAARVAVEAEELDRLLKS